MESKNVSFIEASPNLHEIPEDRVRLIDTGMLLYEASLAGFSERYARGQTSHTIHVWWARRPHLAMRSVVVGALVRDMSFEEFNDLGLLKYLPTNEGQLKLFQSNADPLDTVKSRLSTQYRTPPRVLDMFGGGGTIPFEAAVVGAESHSIDSNQLSVFIQQCLLQYSQNIEKESAIDLLRKIGTEVLAELQVETDILFPLRKEQVIGYLHTYSYPCQSCGFEFFLSKRKWMSKKEGKNIALVFLNGDERQTVALETLSGEEKLGNCWVGRGRNVRCPKCESLSEVNFNNAIDNVVALVEDTNDGKVYRKANGSVTIGQKELVEIENRLLDSLDASLPSSELPVWSGIVNPAIYGIKTHNDFLNHRQRVVLLTLIKILASRYKTLLETEGEGVAKYVIGLLSALVDQLVDWNSRLSMWIPQNEQVGRAFCGPGISMLWDYSEIDPLLSGPANLWSKLDRIIAGAEFIPKFDIVPSVQRGYAQALPYKDDFFDAIVTDPPYYDNIYYSILADFFFAWKRMLFTNIEPDLFCVSQTESKKELVASKFRSETPTSAHEDYVRQFSLAIKEAARVLKPDGVFALVYSHSSMAGWEVILRAYRAANLRITSVQPLTIERRQRPRAVNSAAVNTCIVFVARKETSIKPPVDLDSVCGQLEEFCGKFAESLIREGWEEEDVALAVFANGLGLLANGSAVVGADSDLEALQAIENHVQRRFSSFRLKRRSSL